MSEEVVRTVPLFADLDEETFRVVRGHMVTTNVRRGEILFRENEPGDRFWVITAGKVKLGHTAPDGRESLLAVLGPGEIVGELSVYDPGPRTATATVLAPSTFLELEHSQFVRLLDSHPRWPTSCCAPWRSGCARPTRHWRIWSSPTCPVAWPRPSWTSPSDSAARPAPGSAWPTTSRRRNWLNSWAPRARR